MRAAHVRRYAWRLCPAGSTIDEDCFNKYPLKMVGQSKLRWGGEGGRELAYDAGELQCRRSHSRQSIGCLAVHFAAPEKVDPQYPPACPMCMA